VETYSLPQWSSRRFGGELKCWFEDQAGAVSWGEALWAPPLLVFKVSTTGIAYVLPDRPLPSQLEGIDPEWGHVLDSFDAAMREQGRLPAFGVIHPQFLRGLAMCSANGVVFVWPAFFGGDP